MAAEFERALMDAYRAGRIDRRQFLRALSAVSATAMVPGAALAAGATPIETLALNHVQLLVSDPKRTVDFYQRLFGMPIQAQSAAGVTALRIGKGPQFLAIKKADDGKPRISHYGMTVKNFDADRMLKTLKDSGVEGALIEMQTIEGMPSTPELYFKDPDGLNVQLQHASYAGGGGVHGDVTLKGLADAKSPLSATMYNHCTIFVDDTQRSVDFYRKHFGMFLQVKNTLVGAPDLGIGPDGPRHGHMCLGIAHRPGEKPQINHVCLGMENFDPDRTLKTLNDFGLKSGEGVSGPMTSRLVFLRSLKDGGPALGGPPGGTPEVFLYDPDGLAIQLQDVSFCGEANAGKDGVCPN